MNQIVEVELRGSGRVSLVVDANLLTMDTADRQFVFGLVDAAACRLNAPPRR